MQHSEPCYHGDCNEPKAERCFYCDYPICENHAFRVPGRSRLCLSCPDCLDRRGLLVMEVAA